MIIVDINGELNEGPKVDRSSNSYVTIAVVRWSQFNLDSGTSSVHLHEAFIAIASINYNHCHIELPHNLEI